MRKFSLVIFTFLLFLPRIQAQQSQETKILMEEYLRQSEKQKKTGLIMLGAGAGSVILGTVLGTAWNNGSNFAYGASAFLLVAGSISTLVSIPVLVSSAANGRKAAKLGIGTTRLATPSSSGLSQITYPTWSISIPLNSQKR